MCYEFTCLPSMLNVCGKIDSSSVLMLMTYLNISHMFFTFRFICSETTFKISYFHIPFKLVIRF